MEEQTADWDDRTLPVEQPLYGDFHICERRHPIWGFLIYLKTLGSQTALDRLVQHLDREMGNNSPGIDAWSRAVTGGHPQQGLGQSLAYQSCAVWQETEGVWENNEWMRQPDSGKVRTTVPEAGQMTNLDSCQAMAQEQSLAYFEPDQ